MSPTLNVGPTFRVDFFGDYIFYSVAITVAY